MVEFLAGLNAEGFGYPIDAGRPGASGGAAVNGWCRLDAVADPEALAARLAFVSAQLGPKCPRGVAAAWEIERTAWYLTPALLAPAITSATVPLLRGDATWVRYADGYIDRIAIESAEIVGLGDGGDPAAILRALLGELIESLAAHARPLKTLWRHAGDRIAEAALWSGIALDAIPAALARLEAIQASEPRFAVPPRFGSLDGEPWRPRWTCCLARRVPGSPTCRNCPLYAHDMRRGGAAG